MTQELNDLTIRPITGRDELDLFNQLSYVLDGELADDLDRGRRRPEWMWMALRGDQLVARLAFWSRPGGEHPLLMDVFDLTEDAQQVGTRLWMTATAATIGAGVANPEYTRFIPPDWRDDPVQRPVVESRMAALEQTGARLFVERLRLEWRPGTAIPDGSGRLTFRPVEGRDELMPLLVRVLDATLDAHSVDDLAQLSAEETAAKQYDEEFTLYTSPKEWWQVGTLPGGEPVGFVIPAHNGYNAIIAYIGVLPEHRGNGYIDDILAAGTRTLADTDVPRIRASTDLGNVPMAAAFHRAGYVSFQHEINMVWT